MARLEVRHDLEYGLDKYVIRFHPSKQNAGESWTIEKSFEDCLQVIIREFSDRVHLTPVVKSFDLNVIDLSSRHKTIIEGVVNLYNPSPDLYRTLSDKESLKRLERYFEHELISA